MPPSRTVEIDTHDYNVHLSAKDQKDTIWQSLVSHNSTAESDASGSAEARAAGGECPMERIWPTYDSVIAHVTTQDYKQNLVCPHDVMKQKSKTICPHGSVCCAKMELFPFPATIERQGTRPYTGLFTPGTTVDHCILRLSSAIRPLDQTVESDWARAVIRRAVGEKLSKARIVPGAAIKCFRGNNIPSGNLLFLGSKVGQREEDYFAHALCTTMTEKMPSVALPFVRKFFRYSNYPLSLGVSDFCAHDQDGNDHRGEQQNFPFAVILQPVYKSPFAHAAAAAVDATPTNYAQGKKGNRKNFSTFDSFIDDVTTVPVGTDLFDIYACPDPEGVGNPTKLQRIGRIITTSEIISSAPTDGIYFRHQIREEDFELRPDWRKGIDRNIAMDGGKTKGTVGKLAGWRLFEEDIALQGYVDFEAVT